jgi:hypothetical protein
VSSQEDNCITEKETFVGTSGHISTKRGVGLNLELGSVLRFALLVKRIFKPENFFMHMQAKKNRLVN